MNFEEFIKTELSVLIPVLYVIGMALKSTEKVKDNYIPMILTIIGVVLSSFYVISNEGLNAMSVFTGIVQGVICTASAVYTNQLIVQGQKHE